MGQPYGLPVRVARMVLVPLVIATERYLGLIVEANEGLEVVGLLPLPD